MSLAVGEQDSGVDSGVFSSCDYQDRKLMTFRVFVAIKRLPLSDARYDG